MREKALIDTGFVIALVNKRDQFHEQAMELARRFDGQPLLVTDAVLLEIGNALSRSFKKEAVEIIDSFILSEDVEIIHLTPGLFSKGFDLYGKYQDKEWSLVDCISFIVMRQHKIKKALTFDQHFSQAGFESAFENMP
jgi:predicted nucleic acid-binding protein